MRRELKLIVASVTVKKKTDLQMAPIESPRCSDIWPKGGKNSPQPPYVRKPGFDPCKILDSKRKTLPSLHAERIMTVFQEAVKRMEITTALPYVLDSLPRFSVVLGQELVNHMEKHLRLQNAFKEIICEQNRLLEKETQSDVFRRTEESQSCDTNESGFQVCARNKIGFPEEIQKGKSLDKQGEILAQSIRDSLREMLRYFKKNPKSVEAILGEFYFQSKFKITIH